MDNTTAIVIGIIALGATIQVASMARQKRESGVIDFRKAQRQKLGFIAVVVLLFLAFALFNIIRATR